MKQEEEEVRDWKTVPRGPAEERTPRELAPAAALARTPEGTLWDPRKDPQMEPTRTTGPVQASSSSESEGGRATLAEVLQVRERTPLAGALYLWWCC